MNYRWLLFSFRGRLNRAPFWWITLASLIVVPAVAWFLMDLATALPVLAIGIGAVLYIPFLWGNLAIAGKRLHDRNRSVGWLVVFYLVPSILSEFGTRLAEPESVFVPGAVATLIGAVLGLWGLIEIGFLRGTPGANRFGPDPLGRSAVRVD
ncbi:DUF805 domain-containing protein [Kaistia dalseonensis]|uniref:Uncharacterized membrane protein YhaH (DUF805 family) n=1 Tax=Kaistia dalseonensis TaxID=410840 RepID=A0ABU0H9G6_9HYPH|nr:DUF805 domain-containing protein [Kaistia dalseonensis]MCX5496345.1 DUF805 domain-containing protein [Kaistia dalseonensis]MDQ0438965.1 uncharacterized membrane protein YhaH (DUF805 family) [Kaistia dalseonensis]